MATNKDFVVKNGLQVGANTSIEGSITTVDSVQFDTSAGAVVTQGQLAWNADAGTLDLGIDNGVTLQVGQETHIHVKAGEALTNGDVVYASGAVGNSGQIEVSKYIANGSIEEQTVVGIATQDIASGEFGYVTSFGAVRGLSTDGSTLTTPETWVDGTILYVSPNVAGELTSTLPEAPNQAIPIAFVTSAHASNGILFVRAYELGSHLGELHDVHVTSVANNQVLTYDADNSRWINSDSINLQNGTFDTLTVANLDVTGSITGDLTIDGNLTVSGNTTTVNTNELTVEDLNITLASNANTAADADGAGITIAGANATITYDATSDDFVFNKKLASGTTVEELLNIGKTDYFTGTYHYRMRHEGGKFTLNYYNSSDQFVMRDNGNVGINVATPSEKLSVGGKILVNNGGALYIDSDANGGVLATTGTRSLTLNTNSTNRLVISGSTGDASFSANVSASNMSATTIDATTLNATTINGAFGNTAVTIASSYPVTPSTGNIWFDNLNLKLKVFDGTNWQDAVPSGGGGSANTQTTDANSTFSKYTYVLSSATSTVSGADVANNTLSYDTSGIENVEVFVNGVKQVEGASYDYAATTGTSIGFTTTLSAGDVVDVQVYELLTNDAFVLKAGGAFEGTVEYTNTAIAQTFTNANLNHGMTLISDTDEYLRINREAAGGSGGVRLSAMTDGSTAFNVSAYSTTPSTDGNNAVIRLRASKSNGSTSETSLASNDDLLTIGNAGAEVITVKGSGRTIFKPVDNTEAISVTHNGASVGNDALIAFSNGYTQNFKIGMSDTYGARDFVIVETSAGASTDTENPKYVFNGNGDGAFYITDAAGGDIKVNLSTNGDSYLNGGTLGIKAPGIHAWSAPTGSGALQIGDGFSIYNYNNTNLHLLQNAYYDGGWKHTTNIRATAIHQSNDQIQFRKSSSTASSGASLSWATSVRIDMANDRLGINNSSPDAKLHVSGAGDTNLAFFDGTASNAYVWIRNGTATTGNKAILGFAPANNISGGGIVMEAVEDFSATANRTSKMTFQTRKDGTVYDHITIDQSGHLYPEGTAQDLGTSTKPWQNIYTQDLVLSNEARATGNDIDGTKGNWTVQEGEDHLYLINNKNGKKYRFALEEIE